MGVLNVTSDSFSDGGRYLDTSAAVAHGLELYRAGVDIVDVGGESTRPGASRVDPDVEAARVVPVITELSAAGVRVSVDTMRASVASAAVNAGAALVNDVSGGRADPAMASVVADAGLPWILMHWRSSTDWVHRGGAEAYDDVVNDVRRELLEQADLALAAGVSADRIVLDPGLGFAKNAEHNWQLLRGLRLLVDTEFPILVGASRKRFLGTLLAGPDGTPRPPHERDVATATISVLAAQRGAWGIRVHDAVATLDALAVNREWNEA
ncbi:dihydropteroate synthase [Rhodococcoides trifolii]|uniref:Dihydropteroate synthase n=1 Tax=Rhodococcoides trifolii TaxID=908250 RepID=A0A917G2Z8_9NOCA|nr:dihydropteroate synthase [Rhodococcus trifolii]GGG20583.1 dihydropteroate synthase [Rhodococcus trifolii]